MSGNRFRRGKSGNPRGRPKEDPIFLAGCTGEEFIELCRTGVDLAAKRLIELIPKTKAITSIVSAGVWLSGYAYGKPQQYIDLDVTHKVDHLANQEVMERLRVKLADHGFKQLPEADGVIDAESH